MSKRYTLKSAQVKRVERIFKSLVKFLPKAYRNIQVGLVFTDLPHYKTYQGGYADGSTLNIGTEYINSAPNDMAIAEIIAHELGHHVLGHCTRADQDSTKEAEIHPAIEQDADAFGMMLCELAGYSRKDYIDWFVAFEKRRKKTLSKRHIKEHGTGSERELCLRRHDKHLKESLEAE